MASIELTPEKPEFPMGGWHVTETLSMKGNLILTGFNIEGQMNEHIRGTALYYLDSENITSSDLSFRMQTMEDTGEELDVGEDAYHWLEQVYGTYLRSEKSPCLQNYGSVETRRGRLLAFPNVFQHKVSSFRLKNPTKPGHRRFIALWLVDPHIRIISTANVPPQQMNWWVDSVFGDTPEARNNALEKIPAELLTLLVENYLDMDISAKDMKIKFPPELMEVVRWHFNFD
ncbi:503657a0-9e61-4476-b8f8-1007d2edc4da [Sclerotinia trifoliorum]|uniref:503657a0-9e61-4476-b8f8-1007d2edc4da n=1 Tax=Sclerotinia trifoliorum TaxID=28548 RepID=A0A8H2VVL8_9HELO|nr:503657a0-9e61-4476-b8f8-1007d2edc4da [Sclerotinia trifoliorum]